MKLPVGPKGLPGMSAYEVWVALGNTGSQQDFINSLSVNSNCVCLHKYTKEFVLVAKAADPGTVLIDIPAAELGAAGITASPILCSLTVYYRRTVTDPWRYVAPIWGTNAHDPIHDLIEYISITDAGISLSFNNTGYISIVMIG